jgi:hypothetical protein
MQNAPESYDTAELIVRVWGMANGRAFFQNARAHNLTDQGALLSGIEHPLQPQDVIGLQYADKKARFRVVRVADAGLPQRIQADVELLNGQECPWKGLAEKGAKTQAVGYGQASRSTGSNKRQFPRIKTRFPLELRDERGGGAAMQTNSADISGRGCYVETLVPLPLGTQLSVTFWIESDKINTSAIIRSSDPGVGMGIEFTGLTESTKARLQGYLERVAGEPASQQIPT